MASGSSDPAQVAPLCQVCDTGNRIEWKCITCGEMMCNMCKTIHLRTKALRNHKVVKLDDTDEYEASLSNNDVPVYCEKHPNEQVHMYCEHCNVMVCHECVVRKHNGHTFAKTSDIVDLQKQELKCYIEKSKDKMLSYQNAQKSINKNMVNYTTEAGTTADKMKERYTQLITILGIALKELNGKLQQRQSNDQQKLDKSLKEIDKKIFSIQDFIQTCQNKLSAPTAEMINFVPEAKKAFQQIQECEHPEMIRPPVYQPGDTNADIISGFLGYLGEDEELQKMSDFESAAEVEQKINCTIISSFATKTRITRLIAVDDKMFWVRCGEDKTLLLVSTNGNMIKKVTADFEPYGIAVSSTGDLIATVYHGYTVKKLTKGDIFVDLCDTSPFCTYGIDVTEKDTIILGLHDFYKSRESKIVNMSPDGKILQSILFKTKACMIPLQPLQMKNNNICVMQCNLGDHFRNVVCVDFSGNIKFTYTGSDKNVKDSFTPDHIVTDKFNNIIIYDFQTRSLQLLAEDGHFKQYLHFQKEEVTDQIGLGMDKSGHLLFADNAKMMLYRLKYLV